MSYAVDLDRAFGDVVEAADQVHQRALARAAVADQADHLAGLDRQVEVADHRAVAVAEADVGDLDAAPAPALDAPDSAARARCDTWSRMSKMRLAPAAAFCVTETMRLIESSRV